MICPNCGKTVRNHEFCFRCGYNIRKDENYGDNSTGFLNVFRIDDEYLYIYSVNGKQVVLKSNDLNDLKSKAEDEQFPWKELD